jgi:hypothetical protein
VSEDIREKFTCLTCQTQYRIIRVKADPGKTYGAIHCRVCHTTLTPIDGDDILKYFIMRGTGNTRARGRLS